MKILKPQDMVHLKVGDLVRYVSHEGHRHCCQGEELELGKIYKITSISKFTSISLINEYDTNINPLVLNSRVTIHWGKWELVTRNIIQPYGIVTFLKQFERKRQSDDGIGLLPFPVSSSPLLKK